MECYRSRSDVGLGLILGHSTEMERKPRNADRLVDGCSDRRWVVLAEDGRFSTLGRASDPSEQDILQAEEGLKAQGLGGWLTVMSGSPYGDIIPSFIEVQPLAGPSATFADAVAAFRVAIIARRDSLN